jgi:hypothetical protein
MSLYGAPSSPARPINGFHLTPSLVVADLLPVRMVSTDNTRGQFAAFAEVGRTAEMAHHDSDTNDTISDAA